MDNMRGLMRSLLVDFDLDVDTAGMIRTRSNSIGIIWSGRTVDPEVSEPAVLSQVSCADDTIRSPAASTKLCQPTR